MTRIYPESNILAKSMILTKTCKKNTCFNAADFFERLFDCYGRLLARHPWPFIVAPLISTLVLALGVFQITVNDDLRFLYTQPNSPSLAEFRSHQTFQNFTGEPTTYVNIAIVKTGGGSVLERNFSGAFITINSYILNNLTFTLNGRTFNFGEQLCNNYSYCSKSNEAVKRFLEAYFSPRLRNRTDIKLTYPVMTILGTKVFLASNFYGVTTDPGNGTVNSAALLCLTYVYRKNSLPFSEGALENAVETSIENYLGSVLGNNDGPLSYSVYSLNMLKSEIAKNTWCTLVYLPLSIALLIAFTLATTCTTDAVTSKPLEGLFGVFTSLLAVMSASGLLFFAGVPYNSTVSVMPFLTLALAVDDTYIILAAWHHTDKRNSTEQRVGETLKESGTAITVTALTDVFSFAIGSCSSTPAISAFCQFTAAAVTFDYLYQLTFFCGITALGGRREAKGRHCIFFWLPASKIRLCNNKSDKTLAENKSDLNPMERFFKSCYAKFVSKRYAKIAVLVLYIGFLCLCFYGCIFIKVNLTPSKILLEDSPLNRHINLAESYIWKEGLIGRIYVLNSPDFRKPEERMRFETFVERLENTTYSMGRNSTLCWFREFEHHRSFFDWKDRDYYKELWRFCQLVVNKNWADQLRWSQLSYTQEQDDESQETLQQFYFTSGFHIEDWVDRTKMVKLWREICRDELFADYRAFVYDENNFFADQIESLAPNTVQDCGIAFFCMALICGIFIASKVVLFWVLWSLFAMNLAVIGLLAWWRCDLDPSSVTSILMSIGLTVDFTAHVGYHFSRCKSERREDKIKETLTVAGWPLIQGAISTLLAIFALVFVRSYVVQVFFRTVLLVILSGLLHALLFLPVLFMCTVKDEKKRQ